MGIDLESPSLYINRELSWLNFNKRVLDQATYKGLLPLDRLKFLAIYGTNLDEFYMIRVAGLKSVFKAGVNATGPDKLTPAEQLIKIREEIRSIMPNLESIYKKVKRELEQNSVYIKHYSELSDSQKERVNEYFFEHIYPIIVPIAVDSTHPFPHLNNLSFGIAIKLKGKDGQIKHGLVRIPRIVSRFVEIDNTFVLVESIVEHFLGDLFPGFKPVVSAPYRVTRNADMEIEEEEADDFLEILEAGLRSRNKGAIVRLELNGDADEDLVNFLSSHLKIESKDIYYYKHTPLNLGSFWQIVNDKRLAHLVSPNFMPRTLPPLDHQDLFETMEGRDLLLYHPYESFDPVVKFIKEAAYDPDTLSIRMVLYRVGVNSPIVKALIDAVKDGKQVTALVELRARFDEANNLRWAKKLEDAGAHVVYGIPQLKVHAKIAQVIKHKNGSLQSYLHLATGNYNPTTAKIYTDVSLFTCNKKFNSDATKFFHFLTGFAADTKLESLYMSPTQIKPKLLRLIEKEASFGKEGHMILKANALVDQTVIKALYKASMAGCRVDLIIRGICCLKPGIKGVSENIKVHSIVGKYLEHPRIYWFKHTKVNAFISSADLMPRNLDRRIELMTPIEEEKLAKRLEQILRLQLADNTHRYILQSSGEYKRIEPKEGEDAINSQEQMELYVTKVSKMATKSSPKHISKLAKKLLKES